jgi:hypothetical protein
MRLVTGRISRKRSRLVDCQGDIDIMAFRIASVIAASVLGMGLAAAQTTPAPQNPLRPQTAPRATTQAPAAPQAQTTAPAPNTEAGKPKRQRSQAQLANDNRMRQCGAEWRTNKAALQAQGKTWRVFNVECRARLKAQGQ